MDAGNIQNATLQDLVSCVKTLGDKPALIAIGETSGPWSFARLAATVEILAAVLETRAVKYGEPVALLGPNGPHWVVAYLAVVYFGAVAMPLDERAGTDDIVRLLKGNCCRWLLTTGRRANQVASTLSGVSIIDIDHVTEGGLHGEGAHRALAAPIEHVAEQDVAMILHTSGTTGTPKAVPLTHANLMSNVKALRQEKLIDVGDRALLPLPLHHVYPLTVGLLTPLAAGATVVFPAGVSGPELAVALRDAGITHLVGVPRLYTAFVAELRSRVARQGKLLAVSFAALLTLSNWMYRHLGLLLGRFIFASLRRRIAPRLRLVVSGGAALEIDTERTLGALGWEVLTGYGLTETSPILTFNRRGAKRASTAGRPLPGVELRIAEPAADGIGEIQARGASVFTGYRNDDAATQSAFTPDGWFRTGDLGFIDNDGYLHITGRRTETIVLPGGKKLNPEMVEKAYGDLPMVRELAVLAPSGVLVALVVPDLDEIRRRGTGRAEAMIRDALTVRGQALPPHERFAGFAVTRGPLPRTQLGKLRRHLLPPLYVRAKERREPLEQAPLSPQDRELLALPAAKRVWEWLQTRFPEHALSLDTSPQLDLGVDSLGWINLSLDMQRSLGLTFTEASMARVVTLRDLLREAVTLVEFAAPVPQRLPTEIEFRLIAPSLGLRLLRRVADRANRTTMRLAFRLHVRGVENLPPQPCLICPNHASYLDPFAVAAALPYERLKRTWWGGWTGVLFAGPVRRGFSRLVQVLPVDPDRGAALALDLGTAALQQGCNLGWFPEGVRSSDGRLQPFLPGIGALLERHPTLVVPALITGTFNAWPCHRRLPRFGRVAVIFGPPRTVDELRAAGGGQSGAERIADGLRQAVASLVPYAGR